LASVCAIGGRYGINPDSMVLALAAGGALQAYLWVPADYWSRRFEAALVLLPRRCSAPAIGGCGARCNECDD